MSLPRRRLGLAAALLCLACRPGVSDEGPTSRESALDRSGPQPSADPTGAALAGRAERSVHGRLRSVQGQRVLTVWGSPQDMGFAHGFLLRAEILDVVENYALGVIPKATLESAGPLYARVADVSPRRRAEADAILEGMRAAGSVSVTSLGRDLRSGDLLVLNAMTDLLAIGCSSVSAWGASTAADAELHGAPVVVRNLDWSDDPALLRNQVLIAYAPDDPGLQPVVSVAFAGYFGCLSCVNGHGVTALFNMGYGDGAASYVEAAAGFAPANLALRDAMEAGDVNEDGRTSADDVEAWVRSQRQAGSYILHLVEPVSPGDVGAARVLEVEADAVVTRWPEPSTALTSTMLAATNHLRKKAEPVSCSRYRKIETAVRVGAGEMTSESLWALARSIRLDAVVHTIRVQPRTKTLSVWLRSPEDAADASDPPVTHSWDSLFERFEPD